MKNRTLLFGLAIALSSVSAFAGQDVECTSVIGAVQDPVPVIKAFARDSTKYSGERSVVSLFGDARIVSKNFTVVADEIIYDRSAQTLKIKNLHSLKYKDHEEKGALAGTTLTLKLSGDKYKII